jgi:phosphatidylethanolamine-binding protein (PEBP) family uncharacterized protein
MCPTVDTLKLAISLLALLYACGVQPLSATETGCSAIPCLTPSLGQAEALFEKIQTLYPQYFSPPVPTQTLAFGSDVVLDRRYANSLAAGLATYQGGLWYMIDGAWHRYSSLDEFCNNNCWNAAPASSNFAVVSNVAVDGGMLPAEYSCDGAGVAPALLWSNPPAGTGQFAVMMTTIPVDGATKWSWVLYNIPSSVTGLEKNSSGVGTPGAGSHFGTLGYEPPCSQGPGAKLYTFTVFALSAVPALPTMGIPITGEILTQAIANVTLGSAKLNLSYSRP